MKKLLTLILFVILQVNLPVLAQEVDFIADELSGCDSFQVQFSLTSTFGVTTAEWDFGNGTTFNGIYPPVVTYNSPGYYTVSVTINGNELIEKVNFIGVYSPPNPMFIFNDSSLMGSYNILFTVASQPAPFDTIQYYYHWDFGDAVTYTSLRPQHGHRYLDEGEYIVNLRLDNGYGCESFWTDTVTVADTFETANIFTPNDDRINDEFIIKTNGYTVYSLLIFTRSGTMVYKTESPVLVWDGRNNSGVKMSPGIYYYVVKELNGSGHHKSGFVYLFY